MQRSRDDNASRVPSRLLDETLLSGSQIDRHVPLLFLTERSDTVYGRRWDNRTFVFAIRVRSDSVVWQNILKRFSRKRAHAKCDSRGMRIKAARAALFFVLDSKHHQSTNRHLEVTELPDSLNRD